MSVCFFMLASVWAIDLVSRRMTVLASRLLRGLQLACKYMNWTYVVVDKAVCESSVSRKVTMGCQRVRKCLSWYEMRP
jgi:hypothetical protein